MNPAMSKADNYADETSAYDVAEINRHQIEDRRIAVRVFLRGRARVLIHGYPIPGASCSRLLKSSSLPMWLTCPVCPLFLLIVFFAFFLPTVSAQVPEFTSSDVADAAEKLTGRKAHMTDEIRLLTGTRLAGPAITLRLVRDDKASSTDAGLAVVKLLEGASAGSVVVAVLEDEKGFAVFGASFAALAKARKLAGFVVDGSVRDLAELRRLEIPTLARGTAAGSAGGHYRVEGTNVPITCGGIEVNPGDYIVADEDGVAVAPKERHQEVLIEAKRIQSDERALLILIEKHGSYMKALQEQRATKPDQP